MVVKELTKTVKAQLYDRATSPLFVSFSLSWILWNHRLLVVLFSSMEPREKFDYIDKLLYSGLGDVLLHFGIYPLISTVLIIFAYPYPAKWAFQFWRNRQRELKVIQKNIDDETPLTIEESREIKRTAFAESEEHRKQIERLSNENKLLRERIEEIENLSKKPIEPAVWATSGTLINENAEDILNDAHLTILNEIATAPAGYDENVLTSKLTAMGYGIVEAKYIFGELQRMDFVTSQHNPNLTGGIAWVATQKGRKLLIEHGYK